MIAVLRARGRTFVTHLGCNVVERKQYNVELGRAELNVEMSTLAVEEPKQERARLAKGRVWPGALS